MKTKKLIEAARMCVSKSGKDCYDISHDSDCPYSPYNSAEELCLECLLTDLADRLEELHEKSKAKNVKVVKLRETEYGTPYRCPVCNADQAKVEVISSESKITPVSYCWHCGQKLKWGDN